MKHLHSDPVIFYHLMPVVPPPAKVKFTGLLLCHEPQVKSGTSIELERLATDHSLNGPIELHNAAS